MNRYPPIVKLLLGASALMLTACQPGAPAGSETAPLAGAAVGGAFELTDQSGRTVTDRDFAGKYRIVYFGYSFCPDVCPVDLNLLMLGLKQFESRAPDRAARIQPIFITVDPERDTPDVLARYVRQFHPRLIGLTGSVAAIDDAAKKYVVFHEKRPGVTPGSYLVAHAQLAYLMGPNGEPVALLPLDNITTADVNEGPPDKVAAELDRWVR